MKWNRKAAALCCLAVAAAYAAGEGAEAGFQRGLSHYVRENYKQAAQEFERAIEKDPENAKYHLWAGRATGRRAERAPKLFFWKALDLAGDTRQYFERAVALDGSCLAALRDLFEFYVEAPGAVGGGIGKAREIAARIVRVNAAAGERARARLAEKRNDWEDAERRLREAVRLEPGNVGHRLSLAAFLARRGRYAESDRLYAEALRQAPENPAVWYSRAKALVQAGRQPEEARELLERYLQADLRPEDDPRSYARDLLGQI